MKSRALSCAAILAVFGVSLVATTARAGEQVGLTPAQFKERLGVFLKEKDLPESVSALAAKVKAKLTAEDVAYEPGKKVTWTVSGPVDKEAARAYLREVVRERFVVREGINKAMFEKLEFIIETRGAGAGGGSTTVTTGTTGATIVVEESGCRGCGLFGRLFHRCR